MGSGKSRGSRATSLSRDRVVAGAMGLADCVGVEPVTMRRLTEELGSSPMTLYGHVENKDDLLDGMVDAVFAEIALPPDDLGWREALRRRCTSAREVLRRHSWAVPLMESRSSPGPATLRHHDAVLGCLIDAGMPMPVVAHAYTLIDAFVYGFAIQEASLPLDADDDIAETAAAITHGLEDEYPNLAAFTSQHVLRPGYDFGDSFDVGLDLVLGGIAELLADPGTT